MTWVVALNDKKAMTITNNFQKNLDDSNCKSNQIQVDKGSEFYNRSMKLWLQDSDIEIHSTYNEKKSVVAGRFNRNVKSKIYKYLTSASKNLYIDKFDDIDNEYNNPYSTIKMKPVDIQPNTYIDLNMG